MRGENRSENFKGTVYWCHFWCYFFAFYFFGIYVVCTGFCRREYIFNWRELAVFCNGYSLLLTFMILGVYFSKREKDSNKNLWLLIIISALFITLYSATIGAIFGETIVRGGMETINIEDTLIWGTIYAFIFLPFTTPLARLFIQLFIELLKKYKSTS